MTSSLIDLRGDAISGATPAALQGFEAALAAFGVWNNWPDSALDEVLQEAPRFVMAHVLRAWRLLSSRDPRRVRAAEPILATARALPANARERQHLAAIDTVLQDNYVGVKRLLGKLLNEHPRDVLALQMAHAFDHLTGETRGMLARIDAALPAWASTVPGYAAVRAMHAFALEECGEYARAEALACEVLALDPSIARAHHVMAHVFEMTGRSHDGATWMTDHVRRWAEGSSVATHCWWHLALFLLQTGQHERALAVYDGHIASRVPDDDAATTDLSDLIDASALLWRLELNGGDTGARWNRLAMAWAPHIDDNYCSFSDVHAMLAFTGARDWSRALRLEQGLAHAATQPTRHGLTTRQLGLPAGRALIAFGQGKDALAAVLLASLPAVAQALGGSHAQRDILHLTLLRVVDRMRSAVLRGESEAVH